MKLSIYVVAALCMSAAGPASAQVATQAPMRFRALDRNGDGVITRNEWNGNDRSFRNHDWNGDGKLAGDELRVGSPRTGQWDDRDVESAIDRDTDWSLDHFRALDHNTDGRLSRSEWHASAEMFTRIDRNRDGVVNASEFAAADDDDREDRFADLDTNNDARLSRAEWHGSAAVFDALDANRDGLLTREEAVGTQASAGDEFRSVDVNVNGSIDRNEWHWNAAAFDRLDTNRDNRLTRAEFENTMSKEVPPVSAQETAAYRAGYERGRQEGVQAGREDKPRSWDLEGQRELETADSGYEARLGDRGQYQAGYRAGFRRGYREGFGPR